MYTILHKLIYYFDFYNKKFILFAYIRIHFIYLFISLIGKKIRHSDIPNNKNN